jgi:hypothetical protein
LKLNIDVLGGRDDRGLIGRDDRGLIGRDDRGLIGRDDRGLIGRDDRAPTVGNMVAYFKYQSTKRINAICQTGIKKIWQRNYYDRIIRNEKSWHFTRQYIRNNPANWDRDSKKHRHHEIGEYGAIIDGMDGEPEDGGAA